MESLAAAQFALDATRRHVLSARPDAPVVPDAPARPTFVRPTFVRTRATTASALRLVADALEPRPVRRPSPHPPSPC